MEKNKHWRSFLIKGRELRHNLTNQEYPQTKQYNLYCSLIITGFPTMNYLNKKIIKKETINRKDFLNNT